MRERHDNHFYRDDEECCHCRSFPLQLKVVVAVVAHIEKKIFELLTFSAI